MSSTTVSEFASELKKSTDTLLDQLKAAGVPKASAADALTDADKQKLLSYLQASHGTVSAERKKITLVKKSTTEIKQADATGRARTIQVEVRKKRTFVRRDENDGVEAPVEMPEVVAEAPAAALIDHAELARREEEARRQAELIRRQEEELAERRRQREEQEQRERQQAEEANQARVASAQAQAQALTEQAAAPQASAQTAAQQAAQEAAQQAAEQAVQQAEQAQQRVAEQAQAARLQADEVSKARAAEESSRAADLNERRRKA